MNTAILGLHAETSLHAGAGSALDVVDLPIQREAHTGWPCVFGSAVKGALRSCAKPRGADHIDLIFGPERANSSEHAGALLVSDARLVLLPVRSLTGHFRWITCPALLDRLKRDAERLELSGFAFETPKIPAPEAEQADPVALAPETCSEPLFLEEYRYEVRKEEQLSAVIEALAKLSDVAGFAESLAAQLVVVGNDDFAFLCRHAIPITPHVALDSEKKTTQKGALWYEETLPPETLLYVCLAAHAARREKTVLNAGEILAGVRALFEKKPYLQLGGNETVGMGWCKTQWVEG
jgi:CRISPR-associated protein Cmr4